MQTGSVTREQNTAAKGNRRIQASQAKPHDAMPLANHRTRAPSRPNVAPSRENPKASVLALGKRKHGRSYAKACVKSAALSGQFLMS